jgi:simple sugar transport system permease protein
MLPSTTQSKGSVSGQLLRRIGPFFGLIVIFGAGILLNGSTFLSLYNQMNVLGRVSIIALPAVGMTMVILTAGIDLSVGSMVSLSSVLCAMLLMERTWTKATLLAVPVFCLVIGLCAMFGLKKFLMPSEERGFSKILWVGCGVVVASVAGFWAIRQVNTGFSTLGVLIAVPAVGLLLGSLSGLIIAKGKIQPFIVTLGMMSMAVGLAKFIAGKGGQIHPIYYEAANYTAEGTAHVAPQGFDLLSAKVSLFGHELLPISGLFFLAAVLLVHAILRTLRFGRYVYAIGGNEETARLSGIQVDRIKVMVYALSGGLSALAGVLYCAAYTQGKPDAGATWELDAIAAVVIGGTSLMGGRGSVVGTMVGVLILGYLGNILNLQEVPSEVQDILKGLIILGAVLLQEGVFLRWLKKIRRSR